MNHYLDRNETWDRFAALAAKTGRMYVAADIYDQYLEIAETATRIATVFGDAASIEILLDPRLAPGTMYAAEPLPPVAFQLQRPLEVL